MEKSWVMIKDQTDKEREEYRKLVPQVRCSIPVMQKSSFPQSLSFHSLPHAPLFGI